MSDANRELITRFYQAFQRLDAEAMVACYSDDITFSDPVFGTLRRREVGDMWRMLTSRAKDFSLTFDSVSANQDGGNAHWVARYLFTQTGRIVVNDIQARFVIRDGLISGATVLGYGERVRQFSEGVDSRQAGSPAALLSEFIEGNVLALNNLGDLVDAADLRAAVDLIASADIVYVAGFRRSLPVSSYLAYSLQQLNKKTIFVDGVGGLARQQVQSIGKGDLLIVSAGPGYFATIESLMMIAKNAGAKTALVTAQPAGELARLANHVLHIPAQTMADDQGGKTSVLPMGSLFEVSMMLTFELLVLRLRDGFRKQARH